MLNSLRIANFLLIEDTRLEFYSGLNILTGETGAGKSIIVDALNLLLGERASSDIIRNPGREALIESEFNLHPNQPSYKMICSILDEAGIPLESQTLLIRRSISAEGRSRIFINNTQCLVKKLRDIGDLLIDFHGQHEHQSLFNKSSYLPLVDSYGGYENLLKPYKEMYKQWTTISKQLDKLEENERERKRKEAMLRFQIEEIDNAGISLDEDTAIEEKLHIIQHAERLTDRCGEILKSLTDEQEDHPSILDELERLSSILANMERLDKSITGLLDTWQSSILSLRETSRELENYAQNLEFNPNELETLQQRNFLLRDLKAKYGDTIADILKFREEIEFELNAIEHADEERESLRKQKTDLCNELHHLAAKIHKERKKTAEALSHKVTAELQNLGMGKALFEILATSKVTLDKTPAENQLEHLGPDGIDDIDFLITTIPDKPLKPLREVASGGEVSRIMLALKCVFGEADPVLMMVFDEIDVGIGGKTAEAVADRLALLAKEKQVLCITHLPQIACKGERNFKVLKKEVGGRLESSVELLEGKDKENELARMLGSENSVASKRLAREFLKSSRK